MKPTSSLNSFGNYPNQKIPSNTKNNLEEETKNYIFEEKLDDSSFIDTSYLPEEESTSRFFSIVPNDINNNIKDSTTLDNRNSIHESDDNIGRQSIKRFSLNDRTSLIEIPIGDIEVTDEEYGAYEYKDNGITIYGCTKQGNNMVLCRHYKNGKIHGTVEVFDLDKNFICCKIYQDGNQLEGYHKNITISEGVVYSGYFKNGQMHGTGELQFKENTEHYTQAGYQKYAGNFETGEIDKKGSMEYNDGSKFTGTWKHGVRIFGEYHDTKTGCSFYGEWHDDRPLANNNSKLQGDNWVKAGQYYILANSDNKINKGEKFIGESKNHHMMTGTYAKGDTKHSINFSDRLYGVIFTNKNKILTADYYHENGEITNGIELISIIPPTYIECFDKLLNSSDETIKKLSKLFGNHYEKGGNYTETTMNDRNLLSEIFDPNTIDDQSFTLLKNLFGQHPTTTFGFSDTEKIRNKIQAIKNDLTELAKLNMEIIITAQIKTSVENNSQIKNLNIQDTNKKNQIVEKLVNVFYNKYQDKLHKLYYDNNLNKHTLAMQIWQEDSNSDYKIQSSYFL